MVPMWRLSAVLFLAIVTPASLALGDEPQPKAVQPVHLLDFEITSPAVSRTVARRTTSRAVDPVRFIGRQEHEEFLLDHLPLAATIARRLNPDLKPYHITEQSAGLYEVDDRGSIHGRLHQIAGAPGRRVYLAEGEFRSRAEFIRFTGAMVIALRYTEARKRDGALLVNEPHLYVRIDNVLVHGFLKVLSPLLNAIIDRRIANLAAAAEVVSARLTNDPRGLYREMKGWEDVSDQERAAFRRHFGIFENTPHPSPFTPH
jgi:hypothetical protein